MARQAARDEPGAHHLVTNRGTAQTMLFRSDIDRRAFLALLGQLEVKFGVVVLAYVLMGNHYHLIVRSERGRLARAMQYLDGNHARRFNAAHQRQGALFQGRYDARRLETEVALQSAGHYLHLNPHRAGLCRSLTGYPWSSLRAYARGRSALSWLHLDLLAGRGGTAYLAAVSTASDGDLGRDACSDDELLEALSARTGEHAHAEALALCDRMVAAAFGVSIDELYIVVRGRSNVPRMAVIAMAIDCGVPSNVVGLRYGLRSRAGVHAAIYRLRDASRCDPALRSTLREIGLTEDG